VKKVEGTQMQNPFLVGERIYLRTLEIEDVDCFVKWINDEEVNNYLSVSLPLNKVREKEFIEGLYKDENNMILGIALKANDDLIGVVGLHKISMQFRHSELGIFIGDKSRWSKGYGTEAVKIVIKYGFDRLNLHRIFLTVMDFNQRAINAYEKSGFKREGVFREHVYKNGKYCDVYIMGILKSEWKENGL